MTYGDLWTVLQCVNGITIYVLVLFRIDEIKYEKDMKGLI